MKVQESSDPSLSRPNTICEFVMSNHNFYIVFGGGAASAAVGGRGQKSA
jgi:hypothetical protein